MVRVITPTPSKAPTRSPSLTKAAGLTTASTELANSNTPRLASTTGTGNSVTDTVRV